MAKGSRGGKRAGGTNQVETKSIVDQVNDFINELEDREYGNSKTLVPEKQQQEYRALKREINDHIETWGTPDNLVVFSSGFTNNDQYVHTTAKLNQYQRMVRSEAKNIKTDLSLGIITQEQAIRELFVVKSIDATIKRRRQILNEWR